VVLRVTLTLKALQKTHETVLREGMKQDWMQIFHSEEPEFNASVAKSKIRALLQELDGQ
jgi:hypothetical protein